MCQRIALFCLFCLFNLFYEIQAETELVELEPAFQSTFPHLPAISFNKIYQDDNGILWLGSDQGLYRFDGNKTAIFNSDNSQLSNNVIVDIIGKHDHTLWISTYGGGLVRYDLKTNVFTAFNHAETEQSVSTDILWDIELADKDGQSLWLGSRNWLNLFDTKTKINQRFHPKSSPSLPINNNVWSLYQDKQAHLWIATLGGGLYQFNPTNFVLKQYDKKAGLSHDLVRSIVEDDEQKLWIGTDNGLNVLDRHSGEFRQFFHDPIDPYSLSSNEINKLYKDSSGYIWIGTYGGGLNRYDSAKQRFVRYRLVNLGLNNERTPKIINDIFEDRQGIIWIATDKGVIKLLPAAFAAKSFGVAQSASHSATVTLKVGDSVWCAFGKQLVNFNSKTMDVNHSISLPTSLLTASASDESTLWLSLFQQDVYRLSFNEQMGKYQLEAQYLGGNVSALYAQSTERIWLGRFRGESLGGLQLFEPGKGIVGTWFESDSILDIERLDQNTLLIATNNKGVIHFNLNSFEHNRIINDDIASLNHLVDIYIGNDDRIWLGTTAGGLAELLIEQKKIQPIATSMGTIDWILQTSDKTLWLAANNQLVEYDIQHNTTQAYGESHGLMINKFNKKAAILLGEQMMFGTEQGLFILTSSNKLNASKLSPISLTELKVFNRPVKLAQSLNHSKRLELSYDNYLFSIGFVAPDFQYGQEQKFQYQLAGFDDRWITTDSLNTVATYSSVPPGDYQFKVKRVGTSQQSGSEPSLAVTIHPPWWLTPFAYISYVAIGLLSILLVIHIRTRTLFRRAVELEQGIVVRTTELKQKNETIELLLNQKQRLFTNISHELRTPLALLLGPTEQLLKKLTYPPYLSMIQMVHRNAIRMQHMVEQLLQLASLEAGKQRANKVIELQKALPQIIEAAQPLAKRKQQQLVLLNTVNALLKMQEDSFEQIIGNLLSNAFKYTDEYTYIEIDSQLENDSVIITIRDNGCGIAEQYQPLIFERFERGAFVNDSSLSGSGIGLALVKEWVDIHKGEITFESQLGKGCSFTIRLPVFRGNLPQDNQSLVLESWPTEQQDMIDEVVPIRWNDEDERPILLIVEDNVDMCAHLLNILQSDYRCLAAVDGEQGLVLAAEQVPNIIVCDVMMPVMDGFEFCQRLKQDEVLSHIPIVLLTALADEQNQLQGWENQVDEYLNKPFTEQALKLRLENLLSIRAILRERYASELRNDPQALEATKAELNQKDQQFVERFEQLLEQQFHDSDFQLTQAADILAMSERQLQRKLKAIMDLNFSQILRRTRLQKAAVILRQGQVINFVSDNIGFSSPAYFSTCFRAEFGQSPKKFQQQAIETNREINSDSL